MLRMNLFTITYKQKYIKKYVKKRNKFKKKTDNWILKSFNSIKLINNQYLKVTQVLRGVHDRNLKSEYKWYT